MGIALVCLFLLGVTIEHRLCRLVVMTLAVALMPVTGLQIAMFVTLGAVVVAIAYRPWRRPLAISMAIGLAAGYAVLWATVEALASWQSFQNVNRGNDGGAAGIGRDAIGAGVSSSSRGRRSRLRRRWRRRWRRLLSSHGRAGDRAEQFDSRGSPSSVRGSPSPPARGPRGEFAFYYSCYIELWLLAACVMLLRNVPAGMARPHRRCANGHCRRCWSSGANGGYGHGMAAARLFTRRTVCGQGSEQVGQRAL